jgi:biopolymer transport protein TolQ
MLYDAILKATLPVKIVIFILFSSSILVWALIIYNIIMFKNVDEKDAEFIDFFWSGGIHDLFSYHKYDEFYPSPIAQIVQEIIATFTRKKDITKDEIQRMINQEIKIAAERVSRFQFIYAIIGSSAPFIGLFGTVWGIMHSFHQIGKMGKAGLEVVAPGISEALFTTAMGLFAAIPAVIAYNFFQNKIKKVIGRMEFFASELESYLMKKIQKDKALHPEDSEKYEI